MGLSRQYTAIRGQLLLLNPQPTLSQAYFLLLQEETQRETTVQANLTESAAMSVKHSFTFQKTMKSLNRKSTPINADTTLTCNYCNQERHIRDKCFFLHGYPPWHRLYGQPKPKLRNFTKPSVTASQVLTQLPPEVTAMKQPTGSTSDKNNSETGMFTKAQCQQIMKLIQSGLPVTSTPSWSSSNSTYFHI